jgi:hypothetical protein
MGVFHLAGLGKSPGAVTVPLSYIYYFLFEAYRNNNEKAKNFFSGSGELSNDEQWPGKPEALTLFSSEEVLKGEETCKPKCELFNISATKIVECINEYIEELCEDFEIDNELRIKYIYGVKVNISDFDDCFKKIYITIKALAGKEVWVNLVGGANQINIALMLASSITLVPRRLYYVFEWDKENNKISEYLHPIEQFKNFDNLYNNWLDIPLLFLDIDKLKNLYTTLTERESINISELEQFLENSGLTPAKAYIPKLRGGLVIINGDRVTKGNLFDKIMQLIPQQNDLPQNFSQWKNWAENNQILYRFYESER